MGVAEENVAKTSKLHEIGPGGSVWADTLPQMVALVLGSLWHASRPKEHQQTPRNTKMQAGPQASRVPGTANGSEGLITLLGWRCSRRARFQRKSFAMEALMRPSVQMVSAYHSFVKLRVVLQYKATCLREART